MLRRCLSFFVAVILCFSASWTASASAEEERWEVIPEKIKLVRVTDALFQVQGMNRFVCDYAVWDTAKMDRKIQNFNKVLGSLEPHIPTYFYYVESSRSHPMQETFPEESDLYRYLKEQLTCDACDHLKFSTFETYCDYFYSTDHHWNYRGSYQGYTDIIRMLKGPEEPLLQPAETVVFPVIFNGSFSANTKTLLSREPFTVYRFDPKPAYTAYAKGRKITYDRMEQYFAGQFGKKDREPHYGRFYGGEYGKLVFKSGSHGKGNLLVFEDSMANAVKALMIGHYDQIMFVDLRYYEKETGKRCSMKDILEEFPADQILILTCNTAFTDKHLLYP